MSATVATLYEVNQAKLFLSLIGAPTNNNLLILAVVALIRVSGAGFDVRAAAKALLAGSVYTAPTKPSWANDPSLAGEWSDYLSSLQDKAKAYQLILAAARHGLASDFLYSLALSSWDANHFGGWVGGTIDVTKNRLFTTYSNFTGLTMPTPKQAPPPPAKAIPPPPEALRPPTLPHGNPDPYAALAFYRARHRTRLQTLDTVGLGE